MSDAEKGTEVVRIDCPQCFGNGYMQSETGETPCDRCEGLGMLERRVGKKGPDEGPRSKEEISKLFGVKNPTQKIDPDATK